MKDNIRLPNWQEQIGIDTGVGMMFGQFQVSDLMFPRETRLTFQDFIPYRLAGIDASGSRDDSLFWFAQLLWNRWNDALADGSDASWSAGFIGVDYILDERWVLSGLYNYADAGDFSGDAHYSGIDLNSLTGTVSYYFMRNIKGIFEVNVDLGRGCQCLSCSQWTNAGGVCVGGF